MTDFAFTVPLSHGRIIAKQHRFVATATIDGSEGTILRCFLPPPMPIGNFMLDGLPCLIQENPTGRKTSHSIKAISLDDGESWVGVDLNFSNRLVEHFAGAGLMDDLFRGEVLLREQMLGSSRLDFRAGNLWVEVKTPLSLIHRSSTGLVLRPDEMRRLELLARSGDNGGTAGKKPHKIKAEQRASLNPSRMERQVKDMTTALRAGDRCAMLTVHQYLPDVVFPYPSPLGSRTIMETMETAYAAGLESWKLNLEFTPEGVRFGEFYQGRGLGLTCPLCGEPGHDASHKFRA